MSLDRRRFLITSLAAGAIFPTGGRAQSLRLATKKAGRMRTLEGAGRQFDVWRNPGRFTKNPDIIRFPSAKMMLVFADTEKHWSEEISRITTLESTDGGKSWGNPKVIAEADRRKGEERWVTPRLSRLRSGRLVVICDHDDYMHYHERRPSGTWIWFSDDEGRTWSEPRLTGVPGIEPDRVVELADGTLLMAAHMVFRDNYKLAQFVMRSTDGGITWKDLAVIAKDPVHNHCEGAIVVLSNGLLACVMRENNHNGYPSYVSLSQDEGRSWTRPRPLPFAGDRPYAKELSDGRVVVTYRNQAGNRGTHAWIGDLDRDIGYQVAGVHYDDQISTNSEALHIHNTPKGVTRYILMPPENFRSDVMLEAQVRVSGPPNQPLATLNISRLGLRLDILRDEIWCDFRRGTSSVADYSARPRIDARHPVDMTQFHRLRIQTEAGRMWVAVDGKEVIHGVMTREWPLEESWFGRPEKANGEVWFQHITYHSRNESEPEFVWDWRARQGNYPDQYQIDHMLELHANPPREGHRPDNGYSSWIELPDGRIYFVDYTNRDDPPPTAHLYGFIFSTEDFAK